MRLLILLSILTINVKLAAQDNIIKLDGTEIKAKITKVGSKHIQYKFLDETNDSTFFIPQSKIFMIQYENGERAIFNTIPDSIEPDSAHTIFLPDHLSIKSGLYFTGEMKFGFMPIHYKHLTKVHAGNPLGGVGFETGAVLYFMPKKMPKHFGLGLNFMLFHIGATYTVDFFPYSSSLGPQISFYAARGILVDWYCKPGLSVIQFDGKDYFQTEFMMDVGINFRAKAFMLSVSSFFYPNQPNYSHVRFRIGAFLSLKKRKP